MSGRSGALAAIGASAKTDRPEGGPPTASDINATEATA